eukprot:g28298.t1
MEGIGGVWEVMTMSRRISTEKERNGDDVDSDDDSGAMTDALSFYHRNIRGWLEGLRAHPARRALLLDAKERDYKKAEATRVPDYVSIRDRPLESIGDAIESPRYEDYLKNLPLEVKVVT